jgi:hypothetical protein
MSLDAEHHMQPLTISPGVMWNRLLTTKRLAFGPGPPESLPPGYDDTLLEPKAMKDWAA